MPLLIIDPTNVEQSIQIILQSISNGEPNVHVEVRGDYLDNTNAERLVSFLERQHPRTFLVDCRVMHDGATTLMSRFLRGTPPLFWKICVSEKAYLSPRWIAEGLSTNHSIKCILFELPTTDLSPSWGSTVKEILFSKRDFKTIAFDWSDIEPDSANFTRAMEGVAVQTHLQLIHLTGSPWSDESAASFLRMLAGMLPPPTPNVLRGLCVSNGELGWETMKALEDRFFTNGNIKRLVLPWKFMAQPDIKMKLWKLLKRTNTTLQILEPDLPVRYLNTIVDMEIQQFCKRNKIIESVQGLASTQTGGVGLGIWSPVFSKLANEPRKEHTSPLFLALKAKADEFIARQPCANRRKRPRSTGLQQNVNSDGTRITKLSDGQIVNLMSQLRYLHPWNLKGLVYLAKCGNVGNRSDFKSLFVAAPESVWDCHNQQFDPSNDLPPLSVDESEWLSQHISSMAPSQLPGTNPNFRQLDNRAQKELFHSVSQMHINFCIRCVSSLSPSFQHELEELIFSALVEQSKQQIFDLTDREFLWLIDQINAIDDFALYHRFTRILRSANVNIAGGFIPAELPLPVQRGLLLFFAKEHHKFVQHLWNAE